MYDLHRVRYTYPNVQYYNNVNPTMNSVNSNSFATSYHATPHPYSLVQGQNQLSQYSSPENFVGLSRAIFREQPPQSFRKSNFFNFSIELFDFDDNPVEVTRTQFIRFIEKNIPHESPLAVNNGILYRFTMLYYNGVQAEQDIYLCLVDSATKQPIIYEGQDKNPEMCRVLLTHDIMCIRCSNNKCCGNQGKTPSNPIIEDRFAIRFFLKCNQNCLRNAGNPRDNRRFQVVLTQGPFIDRDFLVASENIFVHNNSKHGQRGIKRDEYGNDISLLAGTQWYGIPRVKSIIPNEGLTIGGASVVIIGENFVGRIQVVFGDMSVWAHVISSHALRVSTPACSRPGAVSIKLLHNDKQYCTNMCFTYTRLIYPTVDNSYHRLSTLISGSENAKLPMDQILKRAADIAEAFQANQLALRRASTFAPPHASTSGNSAAQHQQHFPPSSYQENQASMMANYNQSSSYSNQIPTFNYNSDGYFSEAVSNGAVYAAGNFVHHPAANNVQANFANVASTSGMQAGVSFFNGTPFQNVNHYLPMRSAGSDNETAAAVAAAAVAAAAANTASSSCNIRQTVAVEGQR